MFLRIVCIKSTKKTYEFVFIGSASGRLIPPLIIFDGNNLPTQIDQILPKGWHADYSISGWLKSNIFFNYISKKFYPWLVKENIPTPIFLFVEGHIHHRSLQLSDFCSQHKIILVSFLPNTSHVSQPMDMIANGPLKQTWESKLKIFKNAHSDLERMPKAMFCDLLHKCLNESLNKQLLQESFSTTAIYPFDINRFDVSKLFLNPPEKLQRR